METGPLSALEIQAAAKRLGKTYRPEVLAGMALLAKNEGYSAKIIDPANFGGGAGTTINSASKRGAAHIASGKDVSREQAAEYLIEDLEAKIGSVGGNLNAVDRTLVPVVIDYIYRYPAKYLPMLKKEFSGQPAGQSLESDLRNNPMKDSDFKGKNDIKKNPGITKRNNEMAGILGLPVEPTAPEAPQIAAAVDARKEIKPIDWAPRKTPIADAIAKYRAAAETPVASPVAPQAAATQPEATPAKKFEPRSADERAELYHDLLNPAVTPETFLNKVMTKHGKSLFSQPVEAEPSPEVEPVAPDNGPPRQDGGLDQYDQDTIG